MSTPVYINDISAFLPNWPVNNAEMETVLGQVGPRPSRTRRIVLRNNGIRQRHYAIDPVSGETTHSNAQLTANAIRKLCNGRLSPEELDLLVCGTSTPDQHLPNHAVMVHGELGGQPCEVIGTSGICMAGMTALKHAWLAVQCEQAHRAVATGSEQASTYMRARMLQQAERHTEDEVATRPELAFDADFLRWMLSDGAGAVLLEPTPATQGLSLRVDWIETMSFAHDLETCMYAGATKQDNGRLVGWRDYPDAGRMLSDHALAIKQDVRLLNENIVHYTMGRGLQRTLEKHPMNPADIDWFLPHYSSEYFRDKLHEEMQAVCFDLPQERWFTNLSTRGNTGSASIYLMLEELFRNNRLSAGERLLCFVPESGRFSSAFMHLTAVSAA